jgi:CheY-like chemotaxis protein
MSADRFRILLVEDNEADAYLFQMALATAEFNFELDVLRDGEEALSYVRGEGKHADRPVPDLLVMDLNLPKYDGSEVLVAIRQDEQFLNMPIVITSSSTSPRDQAKVEELGIERYISKPLEVDEYFEIGRILKQILLDKRARPPSAATAS